MFLKKRKAPASAPRMNSGHRNAFFIREAHPMKKNKNAAMSIPTMSSVSF
jgi:hypothetical protein